MNGSTLPSGRGKPSAASMPPPGSDAALDQGCVCPVLDNSHGMGYLGGIKDKDGETIYVVRADCDLHGELYEEPW